MENVTTSPELPKNNQALNETAKSQQPKKTWVEPELAILGVESGKYASRLESTNGQLNS